MEGFVNFDIIGHPINWLIIVMVLLFVFYGMFVIWSNLSDLLPEVPAIV